MRSRTRLISKGCCSRIESSPSIQRRRSVKALSTFGPRPELKSHFPPIYWAINGSRFDPEHAQATPRLGDVEIWRFVYEKSPWKQTHPVHIHLVNFQILDRNGQAPHDYERGWKDTLRLDSGDDVRVIMRFDGYRGRYLMHCHNLEHEDYDMMMRFDVV